LRPEVAYGNREAIHCVGDFAVRDQSKNSDSKNKRGKNQIHGPMLLLIGQRLVNASESIQVLGKKVTG